VNKFFTLAVVAVALKALARLVRQVLLVAALRAGREMTNLVTEVEDFQTLAVVVERRKKLLVDKILVVEAALVLLSFDTHKIVLHL
jgi:hypothetical protein